MRACRVVIALVALLAAGCKDSDGDGTRDARDCAPKDALIHLDAKEVCDGVDNDCNGQIDEDVSIVAYLDRDLDGFGDDAFVRRVCELPDNGSREGGDCDDYEASVHPGGTEVCDGLDQDCDGEVDEDVLVEFYVDADGDGHGAAGATTGACLVPEGYAAAADDCDDAEALAWTGAVERCDGVDNDCDGSADEDLPPLLQWNDADGDGYGDPASPVIACGPGPGIADNALDCDDADPQRSLDATEVRANGFDEDCDGYVDEYGVGPNSEFATLDAAILAAPPTGAVVQLDDGFHVLTADLTTKDLTFAGEGCDRTTLYADAAGSGVVLDGDTLTGMTVSGGTGTLEADDYVYGGGVLVRGDATLVDLCVAANGADRGGGIAVMTGNPVLDGVLVAENSAGLGGGIYVHPTATATVVRSDVRANVSTGRGGGVAVSGGSVTITNTVFAGNVCAQRGCGMYVVDYLDAITEIVTTPYVVVENATFHANDTDLSVEPATSRNDGTAILANGATVDVRNSLFTSHPDPRYVLDRSDTDQAGGRLGRLNEYFLGFRDNAGTDFEFEAWFVDRIAGDPEYVQADPSLPATAWDLRLRAGSGFLDRGDPAILDRDGSPSDLGAYGGPAAADGWDFGLVADDDADGLLDGWEVNRGLLPFLDDSADDPDADGVTNVDEFQLDADPFAADSDGDGVYDGTERSGGTDAIRPQDHAPVADAGLDRYTLVGEQALFDASASFDPNADPLTYAWSILTAPPTSSAALAGAATAVATLVPDVPGTWVIQLSVDDGGTVRTDTLTLRAWDGVVVPDAFPTIQEALLSISGGDAVGVRPGTWYGPYDTAGLDVAIVGLGAPDEVVLDGAGIDSVVRAPGGSLALASLTLENGWAVEGGAVHAIDATLLELLDVTVRSNRARDGGGVWVRILDGAVRVIDSRILDNVADGGDGGGLWIEAENTKESLVVERSLFAGNRAADDGGALRYDGGTANSLDADAFVHATAFVDNEAIDGAAIWHTGGGSDTNAWNVVFAGHRGASVGWGDEGRFIVMSDAIAGNGTPLLFDGTTGIAWQHFDGVWTDVPATPWYASAGLVSTLPTWLDADPLLTFVDDGDPLDDVLGPRGASPVVDLGFLDHVDPDASRSDVGACGGARALPRCARFSHDDDVDGLGDGWELAVGLDPAVDDAAGDADGDGLTNADEHTLGTLPLVADSDRDGLDDAAESGGLGDPASDRDHRPLALATADTLLVDLGATALLDGTASIDPDGDPVTFRWRVLSVPPGSAVTDASLSGASGANASFVPDVSGGYRVGLTVDAGGASSREAVVWVRVPIEVDVPGDYATFDEALAAAAPGTTIHLGPGLWPLTIAPGDKPITIEGDGVGVTILEGIGSEPIVELDTDSDVRLRDLTLAGGANNFGGGLLCDYGTLELTRVRAEGNTAYAGGGLRLNTCDSVFTDVDLVDNFAAYQGAGVYATGGTLTWIGGTVEGNRSEFTAAGAYLLSIDAFVSNVVFHRNTSSSVGAAMFVEYDVGNLTGAVVLDHLTVTGNRGTLGAVYRTDDIPITVTNSIFHDNDPYGFYDADVDHIATDLHHNGWFANGTDAYPSTNVDVTDVVGADPDFVAYDLDGAGPADDLHLRDTSPMRGVGAGALDPDGSVEDLGAFGGPDAPPGWDTYHRDTDGDGLPDGWEGEVGLDPLVPDLPADDDADGLDTVAEHALGTDPFAADSDGDGVDDGVEDAAGDDPADPLDHAPVADAGSDQVGAVGVPAMFVGAGTDPQADPLGYTWQLVERPGRSGLVSAGLSGRFTSTVTITPDSPGRYVLELVVDDGVASSAPDPVELLVAGEVLVPEDYATVDEGVRATADGDTLRIGPGTWPTQAELEGRDIVVVGAGADLTILDGEGLGNVLTSRQGEAVTLQDLTIAGGFAGRGGGMLALDTLLTMIDVTVRDNLGAEGAGLYLEDGDLVAIGVRFVDNFSPYRGGGMQTATSATVVIEQSLFAGNSAIDDAGGAARLSATTFTATNVIFSDNVAHEGGGIYCTGSSCLVDLDHVTATFNVADYTGAFLRVVGSADGFLHDSVVFANHGSEQVSEGSTSSFDQDYTLLAGSDVDAVDGSLLDYLVVNSPEPTDGVDGNRIEVDPLLSGTSDDGDWTNDDWLVDPASPAVDAGDPLGTTDPDLSLPDMGAFGGALGAWAP